MSTIDHRGEMCICHDAAECVAMHRPISEALRLAVDRVEQDLLQTAKANGIEAQFLAVIAAARQSRNAQNSSQEGKG